MKRILFLITGLLLFTSIIYAQKRVVDAVDHSPIYAASVFDAAGNMVGLTNGDGDFSSIPEAAYPVTIRSIGYEQIVIERPENNTWMMIPMSYQLSELVVVPVKRNILKQTFYVREYFSMYTERDTLNFFIERMADRFVAATKDAKWNGSTSLRVIDSRGYSHFKTPKKDSVAVELEPALPSMLHFFDLEDEQINAPESFKGQGGVNKLHSKASKSGMSLVQRQNAYTFSMTTDMLAETKDHTYTPTLMKLFGASMQFKQMIINQTYRVNNEGVYLPKDLIEGSFSMEIEGTGKKFRKSLNTEKPVNIHSLIEIYVVDCDYLSKEEAKDESKNKPDYVEFVVPSTVPPLNESTKRLIARAKAESKRKKY